MYLYFDVNFNLKEIVYYPVREGDAEVDKIYIYIAPENPIPDNNGIYKLGNRFTNCKINFELLDTHENLNPNGGNSVEMSKATIQLPYEKKRDLYFFRYGYKYEMWSVTLPTSVTSATGVITASAFVYNLSEEKALNKFSFNVEDSVIPVPDSTMSQAQYSYLYNIVQLLEDNFETKVPYTGATSNLDLGNRRLNFGSDVQVYGYKTDEELDENDALGFFSDSEEYSFRGEDGQSKIKTSFLTAARTHYLPNENGTFATQEYVANHYVSYTGATTNDNFVLHTGTEYNITISTGRDGNITLQTGRDGHITIYGENGVRIQTGDYFAQLSTSNLTANKTFNLPNATESTETLATQEYVASNYVPYNSAAGNVDLGLHGLTTNELIVRNNDDTASAGYYHDGIELDDVFIQFPADANNNDTFATEEYVNSRSGLYRHTVTVTSGSDELTFAVYNKSSSEIDTADEALSAIYGSSVVAESHESHELLYFKNGSYIVIVKSSLTSNDSSNFVITFTGIEGGDVTTDTIEISKTGITVTDIIDTL